MAISTLTHLPIPPSLPPPLPPKASPKLLHPSTQYTSPKKPHDVVSWTAAIARSARRGDIAAASAAFSSMLSSGVLPNHVTLLTLLSSCADFPSSPSSLPLALSLHSLSLKLDFPSHSHSHLLLSTALVGFYCKSRLPDLARKVFDRMVQKSSVSFNTMVAGLMHNGDVEGAFEVFDEITQPDKVSWTALIDGCVKNGLLEEALDCFRGMLASGVEPDYVTIIGVISACAELGALGLGLWIHRYVMGIEFIRDNVRVSNSLIDMYSRCGHVGFACQVFKRMTKRTLVSWNSMVVGFAINGCCKDAIEHFEMMRRQGFEPDGITFTGVLTACSHAGLADKGLKYYNLMLKEYKIPSRVEHYGCVVDLLGRAGRLDEAMRVVEGMPMRPNEVILGSLLSASRMHGDVKLAEKLMRYVVELEPDIDSNYVLLSNIYAAIGMWDGVGEVRYLMKAQGIKKKPGFSAVEIDGNTHEFVAADRSHPQSDEIYEMLKMLQVEMENCDFELQEHMLEL
ncbi:pentatricopeptide repeat-containing protein At1g05750, chloroplastic [Typha angustifolia]|uniref:pentatricopeptide repeat-containing protein At1g05750, chloroplastic n=1 Tax=Typha angustifolia TaxID=59011 RepID=UPI003C2E3B77